MILKEKDIFRANYIIVGHGLVLGNTPNLDVRNSENIKKKDLDNGSLLNTEEEFLKLLLEQFPILNISKVKKKLLEEVSNKEAELYWCILAELILDIDVKDKDRNLD